jgi:hypothetical protein
MILLMEYDYMKRYGRRERSAAQRSDRVKLSKYLDVRVHGECERLVFWQF